MRNYELTIVLPEVAEAKNEKTLERVEKLVSNVSGKIVKSTSWGKKELFYPIKKQTTGVYYFLNLALPPEGVAIVNREVELDPEVLRHLLVIEEKTPVTVVSEVAEEPKAEEKKEVVKEKKTATTKKAAPKKTVKVKKTK